MITHYEEINDNERRFSWTEDNRLEAVFDKTVWEPSIAMMPQASETIN